MMVSLQRKCSLCTGTVWWSVYNEIVVYVPVQYDGQSTTNVWSMYRYSMMVSLQRKCGLCTGTVWWSVYNESVVCVPVQYDGQFTTKLWSMYLYSVTGSQSSNGVAEPLAAGQRYCCACSAVGKLPRFYKTQNPKPWTLNPKHWILNPKP